MHSKNYGETLGKSGLYGVVRSLFTPYWPYTAYVMAYAAFGIALATATAPFRVDVFLAAMGSIWFGLEGLHALDLREPNVATRIPWTTAVVIGSLQVLVGGGLAAYIALQTTLLFLVFAAVGTVSGLAYNLEWFGGLLHDRDKVTGLANFGLSWGAIPFLGGYFIIAQALPIGAVVMTVGIAIEAARLNYLEGHGRIPRYENVGIEHDRDHKSSADEARAACHYANIMNLGAFALIAIGALLLFV